MYASLLMVHWSPFPGAYFPGLSDMFKCNDSGVNGPGGMLYVKGIHYMHKSDVII